MSGKGGYGGEAVLGEIARGKVDEAMLGKVAHGE